MVSFEGVFGIGFVLVMSDGKMDRVDGWTALACLDTGDMAV